MNIIPMFDKLFKFVMTTVAQYNIDESHGLSHALNVLMQSHIIYESEIVSSPEMCQYETIIYISAIIHDMCDNKYMDSVAGLKTIIDFLSTYGSFNLSINDTNAIRDIVNTMSYSKVKQYGFPDLGEYQRAYHIVRESDLLCAYDFDRCLIYHMHTHNKGIHTAFDDSLTLFNNRVFQHNNDRLFITEYSKNISLELERKTYLQIAHWQNILRITSKN